MHIRMFYIHSFKSLKHNKTYLTIKIKLLYILANNTISDNLLIDFFYV